MEVIKGNFVFLPPPHMKVGQRVGIKGCVCVCERETHQKVTWYWLILASDGKETGFSCPAVMTH